MNRREFVALMGSAAVFPAAFTEVQSQMGRPPVGITDDHIHHYPIYYMRTGSQEVYQLWQPGIIMGISSFRWFRRLRLLTPQGISWKEHDNLHSAIGECPARGLVVDDGFSSPYHGDKILIRYRPRTHLTQRRPLLLDDDHAKKLVAGGHLCRCKPFGTFEEFLKRNSLGEQT